ncbi:MAG: hypothetical protein VYA71_06840 [Pseudomonadota bacterium]|nr:hypothetical protein [Pseudomonadota bacterium]
MKAMLIGFAAAIGIAIVAGAVLSSLNPDSTQAYTSADVRLD